MNPAVPELATVPATWPRQPRLSRWPEAHFIRQWFWVGHPLLEWIDLHSGQVIVGGGTSAALFHHLRGWRRRHLPTGLREAAAHHYRPFLVALDLCGERRRPHLQLLAVEPAPED